MFCLIPHKNAPRAKWGKAFSLVSLALLVGCISDDGGFDLGMSATPLPGQGVDAAATFGPPFPGEASVLADMSLGPDTNDAGPYRIAEPGVPMTAPRINKNRTLALVIANANETAPASQQAIETMTAPAANSRTANILPLGRARAMQLKRVEPLANLYSSSGKAAFTRSDEQNPQPVPVRRPLKAGQSTAKGGGNENSLGVNTGGMQLASVAGTGLLSPNGLRVQHERVKVACLKPGVLRILKIVERHYGKKPVITSGYRSPKRNRGAGGARNSQHIFCKAVDIQVEGISKWALAEYLRTIPGRGGVGTYCRTNAVHIDIGSRRDWHHTCRHSSKRKKQT